MYNDQKKEDGVKPVEVFGRARWTSGESMSWYLKEGESTDKPSPAYVQV